MNVQLKFATAAALILLIVMVAVDATAQDTGTTSTLAPADHIRTAGDTGISSSIVQDTQTIRYQIAQERSDIATALDIMQSTEKLLKGAEITADGKNRAVKSLNDMKPMVVKEQDKLNELNKKVGDIETKATSSSLSVEDAFIVQSSINIIHSDIKESEKMLSQIDKTVDNTENIILGGTSS